MLTLENSREETYCRGNQFKCCSSEALPNVGSPICDNDQLGKLNVPGRPETSVQRISYLEGETIPEVQDEWLQKVFSVKTAK